MFELFGGIALKNHAFSFSFIDNIFRNTKNDFFSGTIACDISDHSCLFYSTCIKTDNEPIRNSYGRLQKAMWMTLFVKSHKKTG